MSLVALWKSSPEEMRSKNLQQLLSFAGDGQLLDGNETSVEYRDFLRHIPSVMLSEYATECLQGSFPSSGLALQDLVNEVGSRLGFQVESGRYRGNKSIVGFDGLWRFEGARAILIEVKTSDTFNVNLDIIAEYRRKLIDAKQLISDGSSILYVVGRNDTGSLEAQVRGSRHAWDIRLISVEALCRLLAIKAELEDENTINRIRSILTPQEFTRVDDIIELVFSAANDLAPDPIEEVEEIDEPAEGRPLFTPVAFRDECIKKLQSYFGESLIKQTAAIYATPNGTTGVSCIISKEYDRSSNPNYWFGFHPSQKKTLENYHTGFASFGCGSDRQILVIPVAKFIDWLPFLNTTNSNNRFYWHVLFTKTGELFVLNTKRNFENIDVSEFLI
jgi:hypothetical protein